jgi:spore coat protein U-like protein
LSNSEVGSHDPAISCRFDRLAAAGLFGAAAICLTVWTAFPAPLRAATATDTFDVTITIQAECVVAAGNTLDFGTQGVLDADVDAATTISIQCTDGTGYTIDFDAGLGSGATTTDRLMTGPASATVVYRLFQDAGRTQNWGNTDTVDNVSDTGTGAAIQYDVYGRVPAQITPVVGIYADTITVTVTF